MEIITNKEVADWVIPVKGISFAVGEDERFNGTPLKFYSEFGYEIHETALHKKLREYMKIGVDTVIPIQFDSKTVVLHFSVKRGTHPDYVELWIEKNAELICENVFGCEYIKDSEEDKKNVKSWFKSLIKKVESAIPNDVPEVTPSRNTSISKVELEEVSLDDVPNDQEVHEESPMPKVRNINDYIAAAKAAEPVVEYCIVCGSRILINGTCSNHNCPSYDVE